MVGTAMRHQPAAHIMLAVCFQNKFLGFLGRGLHSLLKFLGADTLAVIV
jgi:hypothetical protein